MGKLRKARRGTDPGAGLRALRLEQLLREELNSILDGELADERFDGVRVSLVELSRDAARARIWYCMTTTHDATRVNETEQAFERAASFLRARLCDALPVKRMPELTFRHDPAARVEPSLPDEQTSH
ncbi:MAG TPA: 30S ribosome-binding factor RbfA [Polyangiaceae bacterium]|nr:30S ribosome-binding factor RbfA [Polyangiaceae bacterium]